MSISDCLLLGLAWGLLYILLFQMQPNAFNISGFPTDAPTKKPDAVFSNSCLFQCGHAIDDWLRRYRSNIATGPLCRCSGRDYRAVLSRDSLCSIGGLADEQTGKSKLGSTNTPRAV